MPLPLPRSLPAEDMSFFLASRWIPPKGVHGALFIKGVVNRGQSEKRIHFIFGTPAGPSKNPAGSACRCSALLLRVFTLPLLETVLYCGLVL